jgi:hypothetical protein
MHKPNIVDTLKESTMALGRFLFEENFNGKLRWEIVLDTEGPVTQHFAIGEGKYKGVKFTDRHNVIVKYYPDLTIRYQEKGVIFADNGEIAMWNGHGVAQPNKKGGYSGHGSYIFETHNGKGKFGSLNNVQGVYELESDKNSNGTQKWWAWESSR